MRFLPLIALLLSVPAAALAQPSHLHSTLNAVINLGAQREGVVDPLVHKTVTIRDIGHRPVVNATVVIDFRVCTQMDLRLAATQPHHPGAQFDCGLKRVSAVTDAAGVAAFRIAGGAASGPGNPPGYSFPHPQGCAEVYADGIYIGRLVVGAFDNNLVGGVDPADLSNWQGDRSAYIADVANYRGRSDFDGFNGVGPGDGSLLLAVRSNGGSIVSGGSTCL